MVPHTIESIVVETDKVAAFPRSKKAGRKSEEGLLWSFDFQLLSDGEVHRRTTIMSKWTVQPNERAGGAWREGAVAKIKKWIEVAENVERAAAEEAAAQSDAEMEGVVPAVVRTSTLDHSQVMGGGAAMVEEEDGTEVDSLHNNEAGCGKNIGDTLGAVAAKLWLW